MDRVKTHYDGLLGSVYSWILGDFETAHERSDALFERLGMRPTGNAVAVDLGAGPGCQSIPLAARGYSVVAVDFCESLLDELRRRAGALPELSITTRLADIRGFRDHVDSAPELIVCMGDTLVHLPTHAAADALLEDCADVLAPGGSIVISIRDYDAPGPTGADRFIPIRSTDDRIFTCFLEYGEDTVEVHDILQERTDGEWALSVSGYRKLRLGMDRVTGVLAARGLDVAAPFDDGGMRVLHARKAG